MAKSTNINNRRYLGNKYKLLPFIKKVVDSECTDIEIVVDIFSGTGAVASAFQDKQLITNDILYSNYLIYILNHARNTFIRCRLTGRTISRCFIILVYWMKPFAKSRKCYLNMQSIIRIRRCI